MRFVTFFYSLSAFWMPVRIIIVAASCYSVQQSNTEDLIIFILAIEKKNDSIFCRWLTPLRLPCGREGIMRNWRSIRDSKGEKWLKIDTESENNNNNYNNNISIMITMICLIMIILLLYY